MPDRNRTIKYLDLSVQHQAMRAEIDEAIDNVITHSEFLNSQWNTKFEDAFAEYVGARFCVGVANGTDAIRIILHCLDIKKRTVVVPALTAVPTAEAVEQADGCPWYCDCLDDFLIDTTDIITNIKHSRLFPSAIIPVHLYGNACDMQAVTALCQDYDLYLVEDCCQAHGTLYNGKHVGTFGIAGAFSFYPSKNLGALGDAGAIVTNDKSIESECRIFANHGASFRDMHNEVGCNSRMDSIQAAILLKKLAHLNDLVKHRREIADMYSFYLPKEAITLPTVSELVNHSYHIYAIQHDSREALRMFLSFYNIETLVHYPAIVPDQAAYMRRPMRNLNARTLAFKTLSLPIGPHIFEDDVKYIAECITIFCEKNKS